MVTVDLDIINFLEIRIDKLVPEQQEVFPGQCSYYSFHVVSENSWLRKLASSRSNSEILSAQQQDLLSTASLLQEH